jgi:hypothetical protein
MPNYNINVENFIGNGRIRLGGSYADNPFGVLDTTGLDKININQAEALFHFLSQKSSLTAAESAIILNDASAVASQTATLSDAADGALAGDDGFATNLTVQFLTGNISSACDIGAVNPFRNTDGDGATHKSLIVFKGNTLNTTSPITFSLNSGDGFDASAWNLIVSGSGNDIYTLPAVPGNDTDDDLTLTSGTSGMKILNGSYIYFEWNVAQTQVAAKGLIRVSGGTLTIDTAAP